MTRIKTVTLITVAAAALTLTNAACRRESPPVQAEPSQTRSSQLSAEFETVRGKWLRPDGGYVLELKALLAENQLTAGYFNPGPIHVGEAKIYQENGFLKVFVKMQDKNYPGSTYTLIYDKESDRLRGIYFQAVQGVEYEVEFTRQAAE